MSNTPSGPADRRARRPWVPPALSVETTRQTATGKSAFYAEATPTSPACPGCPHFMWNGPAS